MAGTTTSSIPTQRMSDCSNDDDVSIPCDGLKNHRDYLIGLLLLLLPQTIGLAAVGALFVACPAPLKIGHYSVSYIKRVLNKF